ncbi:CDG_1a_G0031950.mRNA.1.CDS.1 [Saccharomyces cerevisiae]|nr:CDG_1a_G0031950.mRNA.1.CDS.1 [Saccharomyces cerevisiae]CAI7377805.1 CDG_1a_G0031950.mRNA.1.CDS.1 [Saccharomyces cerevisiae]
MATDTERCIFRAFGQDFILNKHFHLTGKIGRGSHSLICSSTYTESNEETHVAIRKIPNAFGNKLSCKRTLRELKLLRHLRGHPNIVWLFDTDIEIASQKVYNYIFQFGNIPGRSFESILPGANPEALELLKKMLEFDPKKGLL